MLTTARFRAEAPYCLDDDGAELSPEEQLRIEAEIADEAAALREERGRSGQRAGTGGREAAPL